MNAPPRGIPLRPTPIDQSTYLRRACWAEFVHACHPYQSSPEEIARARWPDDSRTPAVLKGTSVPAATTTSGWAAELSQANVVGDFIQSLAPLSAAASLFNVAVRVSLAGIASV